MFDHLEDIIDNRPEQLSDIAGRMIYGAPSDTSRPVSGPAQRRAEWLLKARPRPRLQFTEQDYREAAVKADAQAERWAAMGDLKHYEDFTRRAELLRQAADMMAEGAGA